MAVLHTVAVQNHSTVLTDAQVQAAMPALQHQANYHFRPYWDAGCSMIWLDKAATKPTHAWLLVILDNSDQAGALGYHDENPDGTPIMKVFAKTDQTYGLSWTVTASHELLEALADPDLVRAMQVTNTEFYALEVGDPVEDDSLGYTIKTAAGDQIKVSDFILPAWFNEGQSAIHFDYMGHCSKALEVTPGGYVSIYVSGQGWTTKQMQNGQLVDVVDADDTGRIRTRG